MGLEFHQLDPPFEHLRPRHPERERRLPASLATSGQQVPIVVVAGADQPDCYLVIDGYKRIAALKQLGRDTVSATVWSMSEAEELVAEGAELSYPALTAFRRRHGIGQAEKKLAGQYSFMPGEEMQHDTSPHRVVIGGKARHVQTASAVLCYSRMLFFQFFPRFQRFDCKVFLTDAHRYFGGCAEPVMIDNTHVVVLRGTGRQMIPVPEMADYRTALKKHGRKLTVLALRQLLRMMREYPRDDLTADVEEASRYGLYDLDRVERMVLRRIARDYFLLDDWKGNAE